MYSSSFSRRLNALTSPITVGACVGLALTDGILAAITPGYDAVGETSSQLMSPDARYSEIARTALGLYAVLIVPFATRMTAEMRVQTGSVARVAVVLVIGGVWVHLAATMVTALALNDSDNRFIGNITANETHDMAARVMFGAGIAVMIGGSVGYRAERLWIGRLMVATAILATAGSIFFALEIATDYNGVVERFVAVLIVTWISLVAITWRIKDRSQAMDQGPS